jgi:glycosyltransferase involved in cell wall biosynthesis
MFKIPREIKMFNIPGFLILYDTMPFNFPEYYPEYNSSSWYMQMVKSINKKTYCFCISESTRKDYLKYLRKQFDENKIFVTHISSAQDFVPDYDLTKTILILKKYGIIHNINSKYILSFCSLEPRKNIIFTVTCFLKFVKKHGIQDLYFYIGGAHWDLFIQQLNETVGQIEECYRNRIIRLGYVSDEDVNALYSNSLFFIYLSQYEGFGMPPLEAMQAGVPVITSNNSSLPEVVGDATITIPYNDEEALVGFMEKLYFNTNMRMDYITRGLNRAKQFSWKKTTDKMAEKIISVVENVHG